VFPVTVTPETSQHVVSVVGVPFPSVKFTTVWPLAQNDRARKSVIICFECSFKKGYRLTA
jgi:hypothetical protein